MKEVRSGGLLRPVEWIDEHGEEVILVALLILMTVIIGLQIFMRYLMHSSLSWSEELARYFFIWATYIGASYAVKKNAHVRVTATASLLPSAYQPYLNILVHLVFGIFAVLVVYEGMFLVDKILSFGQISSSLGIPMGYIYLAPVVGFSLVILRLLQKIYEEVKIINNRPQLEADQ